ncbi:hypothetical protein BU25DRAFT_424810 [Macroventuria anomochaeta]|uniref:Uncharacterized protein n=1 Tax=Macroventuria anomochaeta TaxID=301207 RepID=A0ACB6RR04_9PLEO|nr:uncharacterized protein BU25DRAFT_424810 [Macroventuria anomochaeta]KAF2623558.1 hypothetical protein BU25DRAFT_424810 [Macroventuria anomochaeta]
MARLSEEYYRAIASVSVPKPARTSGRLRDIFKPRRSDSSTSPKTLTKSPPAAIEPVGVLPSDRESLHAVAKEASDMDGGELKPSTGAKGSVPSRAGAVVAGFSGVQAAEEGMMKKPSANDETDVKEEVGSIGSLTSSTPVQDDTFAKHDTRSHQKSFALNIFDDQDSLSAGIREYVESKIAQAFSKHRCGCPVRSPINFTVKFEVDNLGNVSRSSPFKTIPRGADILFGHKTMGPFTITNGRLAINFQIGIIALYLLLLFFSAFTGPKTFLLTVWRISVALLAYAVICSLCNWKLSTGSDLLLAPIVLVAIAMQNPCCDILDQYGIFRVYVASNVIRDMITKVSLVFQPVE